MYKNKLIISGFISLGIMLLACNSGSRTSTERLFEHVVIIGIDGLTFEGLQQAKTPVMDNLIANGAVKYNARAVLPSSTVPNWGAMIHGAGPEVTGITSNSWMQPDARTMTPAVINGQGLFPGIFDVIRSQLPEAEQGLFINWDGFGFTHHFGRLHQRGVINRFDRYLQDEILHYSAEETARQAGDYLISQKPAFFFVIFNHVDGTGHDHDFGSDEYIWSVAHADSLVGHVMESLCKAGMKDNTLVMVLADHGGTGRKHGGETDEEANVPYMFWGTGIKKNYIIQQPVYAYDIAATVAFALNLKAPFAWTGRPVMAAFEGHPEPDLSF